MHSLLLLAQTPVESGSPSLITIIFAIAVTVLALVWLLLPLLVINELGKVRRQLLRSEENVLATLRQLTPVVQQLEENAENFRQLTAIPQQLEEQAAAHHQALETLEAISVHLFNIDGEMQHTNSLLEWVGTQRNSSPATQTTSSSTQKV